MTTETRTAFLSMNRAPEARRRALRSMGAVLVLALLVLPGCSQFSNEAPSVFGKAAPVEAAPAPAPDAAAPRAEKDIPDTGPVKAAEDKTPKSAPADRHADVKAPVDTDPASGETVAERQPAVKADTQTNREPPARDDASKPAADSAAVPETGDTDAKTASPPDATAGNTPSSDIEDRQAARQAQAAAHKRAAENVRGAETSAVADNMADNTAPAHATPSEFAPQSAPESTPESILPPYRIQIGDTLDIRLFLNPELNEEVTVRPDGMISTSIVQDIMAYDRTPAQLQQALIHVYKNNLKDPKLTVIVRSFAPTRVYVMGEVAQPGELVSVGPNLTILQAIARAGGVKNSANTSHILVMRRGAGRETKVMEADYDAAASGRDPHADARLAPYDVVYVPRTGIADAYLYYQQYLQQFVPTSFGLSYQLNPSNTRN